MFKDRSDSRTDIVKEGFVALNSIKDLSCPNKLVEIMRDGGLMR